MKELTQSMIDRLHEMVNASVIIPVGRVLDVYIQNTKSIVYVDPNFNTPVEVVSRGVRYDTDDSILQIISEEISNDLKIILAKYDDIDGYSYSYYGVRNDDGFTSIRYGKKVRIK